MALSLHNGVVVVPKAWITVRRLFTHQPHRAERVSRSHQFQRDGLCSAIRNVSCHVLCATMRRDCNPTNPPSTPNTEIRNQKSGNLALLAFGPLLPQLRSSQKFQMRKNPTWPLHEIPLKQHSASCAAVTPRLMPVCSSARQEMPRPRRIHFQKFSKLTNPAVALFHLILPDLTGLKVCHPRVRKSRTFV
jgi:hypothetical protein